MAAPDSTTIESTREFAKWLKDNKKEICRGSTLAPTTKNALSILKETWENKKGD